MLLETDFLSFLFLDFRNELSAQTSIDEDDSDRPITQENEEAFYRHFQNISGRDLAISAWELQTVLNRVVERCYRMDDAFSIETCRALGISISKI